MPLQHIHWNEAELVLIPRSNRKSTNEVKYPVTCSVCGYRRLLKKGDANKAAQHGSCKKCHCRANGVKTISKHGKRIAKTLRTIRMNCPSSLETLVMQALDALDLPYEREVLFDLCNGREAYIDFKVQGKADFFLEANGFYYHGESRAGRDGCLLQSCHILGIPLLIIHDLDPYTGAINSLDVIQTAIDNFNQGLTEQLPF